MNTVIIVLNCILFISLLILGFSTHRCYKKNNLASRILEFSKENEKNRKNYEEELRIKEGNQEKENIMFKLDLLLEGSGIKNIFKKKDYEIKEENKQNKKEFTVTTEIFIAAYLLIFVLITLAVSYISSSGLIGLSVALIFNIAIYGILCFIRNYNQKRIEEEILSFINIMENFSKYSDDIVQILGNSYKYIDGPLKQYIFECYFEAYESGDIDVAIQRTVMRIQHPLVKDLLRNILICSHYKTNYDEIIKESRRNIKIYLANVDEKKQMKNSAKMEIFVIIGISIFILFMVSDIIGKNVFIFLINAGSIGIGIIIYLIMVAAYTLFNIINISND